MLKNRLHRYINLTDGVIIFAFALYALLFFLGRWQGQKPFVFVDGDAANISAFAAAFDHPQDFIRDPVLTNSSNFRWYLTIHIPVIRFLRHILGDYGSSFVSLLGFHVFFQALGFYLLGRLLFKSRFWAFLLAILTLATIWSPKLYDYWGVFYDAQPRFTFQVFLPYLLCLAVLCRSRPSHWTIVMVVAGLLIYIHPVSAPAWGFAVWLSFFIFLPSDWSWKRRIGYMALQGLIYLVILTPFMINYFIYRDIGQVADYEQIYALLKSTYGLFMDIPAAFLLYLKTYLIYLLVAAAGVVAVFIGRQENRLLLGMSLLWLLGVIFISVGLATIDHQVSRYLHRIPTQLDLVRGIRFIAPFMALYWLWGLITVLPCLSQFRFSKWVYNLAGTLLIIALFWSPLQTLVPYPKEALSCWASGKISCAPLESQTSMDAKKDILKAIVKYTQPGTRVFPLDPGLALETRYYALRPVAFCEKDTGMLSYANTAVFLQRQNLLSEYRELVQMPAGKEKFQEALNFSDKVGGEIVVVSFPIPQDVVRPGMILYQNQVYSIINPHP